MTADEVFKLAEKFEEGNECDKNVYLAAEFYYKSYIKGNVNARFPLLRRMLLRYSLQDKYLNLLPATWTEEAIEELHAKADDNNLEAKYLLAWALYDGIGNVEKNEALAIDLCKQLIGVGFRSKSSSPLNMLGIINKSKGMYEEAINCFKQAIDEKYYTAASNLAFLYYRNRQYVEDETDIERLFKLAADNGVMIAQNKYADLLMAGECCSPNKELAIHYYLQSASQGFPSAQLTLGRLYLDGTEVEENIAKGISWLIAAAENYNDEAVELLDSLIKKMDDYPDIDRTTREKMLVALYKNRHLFIEEHLAKVRFEKKIFQEMQGGTYVRRDETIPSLLFVLYMNEDSYPVLKCGDKNEYEITATKWLQQGVEILDIPSIRILGECYENDVPLGQKNIAKAVSLYKEAYEHGSIYAGYLLGNLYFSGEEVNKNVKEALEYYREASHRDCGEAHFELGNLYLKGEHLEANIIEARNLYEAINQDNCSSIKTYAAARCNLGCLYQYGIGINVDQLRATELYREAISYDNCDNDGTIACNLAYTIMKYDYLDSTDTWIRYFEEAINKNNSRAMYNLALLYIRGEKIHQNFKKAFELLEKASSLGLKNASILLAVLYKLGYGCEQNDMLAKEYLAKYQKNWIQGKFSLWLLTHRSNKYYQSVEFLENQIIPEKADVHNRVQEYSHISQKQDSYHDLEPIISHLNVIDSLSDKARNAIVLMFENGKSAPKSKVLADYWKSYSFDYSEHNAIDSDMDDNYYDLQAELERKFDELFGPIDNYEEDENAKSISDKKSQVEVSTIDTVTSAEKNIFRKDVDDSEDVMKTDTDNIITLNDEDGNEVAFEFLDLISYCDQDYVILLPVADNEDEEGEVVILRIEDSEDSESEEYASVDSEEVLMAVFNIFKQKFSDEFEFIDKN